MRLTADTEPAPRILVVDDVAANVRLLEAIVEPAGFALSSASSGPEALERADQALPRHDPRAGGRARRMEPDARGARRGTGGGARADGATAPLPLADARRGRDVPRRQRARKPPARARRPLRRSARLDRFQRGHGAGGGDERRRLLPLGDGAVGSILNLASRLCDAAEPGQIVVSRRLLAEVEQIVEAEPLGRLELKGFGTPVEAFAVSEAAPA